MGLKGACPSVSSQAEVKKLATDLPSQPAVVANPTKSLSKGSFHTRLGRYQHKKNKYQTEMDTRITLKSRSAITRQRHTPVKV